MSQERATELEELFDSDGMSICVIKSCKLKTGSGESVGEKEGHREEVFPE